LPLNILLGFYEDYQRVIVNTCHELIIIQARNDNNCFKRNPTMESELELFKVQFKVHEANVS